jgi:very-short-patch-repair endonuclease
MRRKQIHNLKLLEDRRKSLRNNSTSAEAILWSMLKDKKIDGKKIRRQHSIMNYIIDFYCSSEKLAVELDGDPHFTLAGIKHDAARTKYLNNLGIKVLRFENNLVFDDLESILTQIRKHFKHPPNSDAH